MTDIILSTSLDPVWNLRNAGINAQSRGAAYGNNCWILPSWTNNNFVYRSMDGVTWENVPLPRNLDIITALYSEISGLFLLILGRDNPTASYFTSPNGLFWTERFLPIASYWQGDVVNGNIVCLPRQDGRGACVSRDGGLSFSLQGEPNIAGFTQGTPIGTVYLNGVYTSVAVPPGISTSVIHSTDLVTWGASTPIVDFGAGVTPVAGNGIMVGGDASAKYSLDFGLTWQQAHDTTGAILQDTYDVVYDEVTGLFVTIPSHNPGNFTYVSDDGMIYRKTNRAFAVAGGAYKLRASNDRKNSLLIANTPNGILTGNTPTIRGQLFVPHNFTKLIQVQP